MRAHVVASNSDRQQSPLHGWILAHPRDRMTNPPDLCSIAAARRPVQRKFLQSQAEESTKTMLENAKAVFGHRRIVHSVQWDANTEDSLLLWSNALGRLRVLHLRR